MEVTLTATATVVMEEDELSGCAYLVLGFLALVAMVAFLMWALESEFEGCKGLKGVVDQVWTGEQCEKPDHD